MNISAISATRNTCFAIISAIEDDFRSLILALAESCGISADILPSDVRDVSQRRRIHDARLDSLNSGDQVKDVDLLPYIDFADISKIIDAKFVRAGTGCDEWLSIVARSLLSLTGSRNRVCHTRPLEPDDLIKILDFAKELLSANNQFSFPGVASAINRLETAPTYVLTLQIPSFWSADLNQIHNNLPIPEFDETGFLGRAADRLHVSRLLKSHYPVVTIVGEGGIGKTALALRCLYDLLDEQGEQYDAIVWVSMKTAALTQAGVRDLTGAIKSTLGLLSEIVTQLGNPKAAASSEDELIDEIVEYLELYRVVVAIDNLETISTGSLRALLERIPAKSKVLLTSRVGVGEFEVRYPLQGLDEKTSISLFRIYARLLGVFEISRLDDGHVKGYCRKLFQSPLLIKWFVSSVGRGADPAKILVGEGRDFSAALSFCFENLFDRFGSQEKIVIHCLACAKQSLSSAEIRFLAVDLTDIDAEIALSALHNSSIVSRAKSQGHLFEYSLSESAVKFLNAKYPPTAEFFKSVQGRMRELRNIMNHESRMEAVYEYNPFFVRVGTSRDEKISATYLRVALDALRENDLHGARTSAAKSIELTPEYSEAWRICGLIEERAQEFYKASEYYNQAIGADPNSKIARYCYGMFLSTDMDDFEGAISQFVAAEQLDPDAPTLLTAKAMALARSGKLEEAVAIHEMLLPSMKDRERRWRISGADQAADCYRKLAIMAMDMKEFDKLKSNIRRSLQVLLEAAERSDSDQKLLGRLSKVVQVALSKAEVISDIDFVEFVVTTVERIVDFSGKPHIGIPLSSDWIGTKANSFDNHHARLVALDRRASRSRDMETDLKIIAQKPDSSENGRMIGAIHNVSVCGRYAFVENETGERWFTHSQFMRNEEDWARCKQGSAVSFMLGQNAKGVCAVDVCLADR